MEIPLRERWQLVSPHLDRALDLVGAERQRYLRELAAEDSGLAQEVGRLLDEEQALREEDYLEHDPADLLAKPSLVGQVVGSYLLERFLGAGGMGSVWLARRSDGHFEGKAAVKLLSAALLSESGASRFRREGTILARLRHPNISQLIDAGVSEAGQPYLVLEYVEGEPLDRWCDQQGLDVRARVRLFLDVLAAVAHAHACLVVHRDLKPSNVMVSKEGRVKLLDFGIAKLLEGEAGDGAPTQLTRDGGLAFTPAFAAPEQVKGESVTTATDVYALGALLYLLLAGRHPIAISGESPVGWLRSILETEPPRLSDAVTEPRLRRELQGDLEVIVARALKKRPEERYSSVAALAEDLRRYLAEEPILARCDSLIYRARKFTRRHARALAALSVAAVALAGVMAFYGTRLAAERDRAARMSGFLGDLLSQADPFHEGPGEPTVRSLLDTGTERAREDLAGQPELQREVLTLLGRIYVRRGDSAQALPLLEQAVALGRRTLGPSRELAQSLTELGVAHGERAELAAARAALEEALALRRRFLGEEHPDTAVTYSELGRVLFDQGNLDEAEKRFRSALAIRRKVLGPEDHETATSMSDLGLLLRQKGDRAGAEALFRETLEVTRKSRGPGHPDTATALANLALTVNERGDPKAAESMFRQALAIGRLRLEPNHPAHAQRLANLANTLRLQGKLAEAAAVNEEALSISRPALGPDHPSVARQEVGLARVYLAQGRPVAALPLLRHALGVQEQSSGGGARLGTTLSLLGEAYTRLGRYPEAETCLRRASGLFQASAASDTPEGREARDHQARLAALKKAWASQ